MTFRDRDVSGPGVSGPWRFRAAPDVSETRTFQGRGDSRAADVSGPRAFQDASVSRGAFQDAAFQAWLSRAASVSRAATFQGRNVSGRSDVSGPEKRFRAAKRFRACRLKDSEDVSGRRWGLAFQRRRIQGWRFKRRKRFRALTFQGPAFQGATFQEMQRFTSDLPAFRDAMTFQGHDVSGPGVSGPVTFSGRERFRGVSGARRFRAPGVSGT
jgi:hypothetical protein